MSDTRKEVVLKGIALALFLLVSEGILLLLHAVLPGTEPFWSIWVASGSVGVILGTTVDVDTTGEVRKLSSQAAVITFMVSSFFLGSYLPPGGAEINLFLGSLLLRYINRKKRVGLDANTFEG